MTDVSEMDPDLVRPPGFQTALHEARKGFLAMFSGTEGFLHAIAGARRFPLAAQNGHAFAVEGIAAEIPLHQTLTGARRAPDDGLIGALDGMRGELLGQAAHGALGLGHHQQAARVLVKTVDDTRARHAADSGKRIAAMGEERIDQRAVEIARRGMHNQTCRFVDDEQVGILMNDDERYGLRLRFGRSGQGNVDHENLARFDPLVGVSYRFPGERDAALRDKALQPRTRKLAEVCSQEMVEPPAFVGFAGAEFVYFSVYG